LLFLSFDSSIIRCVICLNVYQAADCLKQFPVVSVRSNLGKFIENSLKSLAIFAAAVTVQLKRH